MVDGSGSRTGILGNEPVCSRVPGWVTCRERAGVFMTDPISIVNLVEFTAVSKKTALHVIPAFADLINSKKTQIRKRGTVRRKNSSV